MDKKAKFLRAYANVPEKLRDDIVIAIDQKPYTWNTAYLEIKENTQLGQKILKTLAEMGII